MGLKLEQGASTAARLRYASHVPLIVIAVLGLSMIVFAACGSSDSDPGDSGGTTADSQFPPPTAAPSDAAKGGDLTVLTVGDVDYIDPGAAYYQFSYMLTGATQRQLLSWAPADTTEPTPDIATDQPTISDGGKTITYHLQSGIKFSPPVNRDVVCDDFKYAIDRALLPGVANGYLPLYFTDVVGFADAEKAAGQDPTQAPDIAGITCPDDQTLEIKLTDTSELGVIGALSLPIGSPVPRDYAAKYDAENPSTYGDHQVATGPYMIENDSSGELTGYTSGKEIHLVRNPNWDASSDFRPAYLDSITFQEGFTDTDSAAKKILSSDAQVNGDFGLDATSLKLAATQYPDQLTLTPSGGNRYISLNTTEPPFDDINVRKAVIAASNRTDLRNTRGGELVGDVASHFITPGMPGFEEAGGVEGPDLDFIQNPNGDLALAESYMKKAGFSSGKCEGSGCEVTMVGDDAPPGSNTAEVFKDQLEQLGFNVDDQKVDHSTMITKFCGVPKNEPDVCANFGWIKDFQDPQAMLQNTFSGDAIVPSNNSNWPLIDDPTINKAIHDAVYVDDPQARAEAWGKVDDMVTAQAVAVPWVWDNQSNIRSADVDGVINLFNATWDLSFTSLAQ
jgi:peptide/nickel transport system substrate-binding protein